MEDSSSSAPPVEEMPVLEVKPLRCLTPMFPSAPSGYTTLAPANGVPYVCMTPNIQSESIPPNSTPNFPTFAPPESQRPPHQTSWTTKNSGNIGMPSSFVQPLQSRPPLFHTPPFVGSANDNEGPSMFSEYGKPDIVLEPVILNTGSTGDGSPNRSVPGKSRSGRSMKRPLHPSSYTMGSGDMDGSDEKRGMESTTGKNQKRKAYKKLTNSNDSPLSLHLDGDEESVERLLLMFDALRRRLLQLDDRGRGTPPVNKRTDLKAGTIMMAAGHRTNMRKRIGPAPGVEVGDLFFFRFEMCVVGLHAPSMAGIDYMSVKFDQAEESIAVSIVSSGMYEDEVDDTDVLIYSGQGGISKPGKQVNDQKLERGNLALENSSRRGNEIRVIRGFKDGMSQNSKNSKIYIYDGLYTIQDSWTEIKEGFNIFKYRMLRIPGQPDGSAVWKLTQQWKQNPPSRGDVILPDISSGAENVPVCLVNDVDQEKGPAHFSYATRIKYLKAISLMRPSTRCNCQSPCIQGDAGCSCSQINGGDPPYTCNGLLVIRKPLIYECSSSCQCTDNCRNRVAQLGVKFHFEVFKTRGRGWGLRSWDPIRAGSFICEYTGEVIDRLKVDDDDEDDEYIFWASHPNVNYSEWNYPPELLEEEVPANLNDTSNPLPIMISAKNMGNISRFMNHSCSPNVFWQPVLYDHFDEGYPHIMFYALKHIPPMTELTYDYGLNGDQSGNEAAQSFHGHRKRQKCLCGSFKCRGFFG